MANNHNLYNDHIGSLFATTKNEITDYSATVTVPSTTAPGTPAGSSSSTYYSTTISPNTNPSFGPNTTYPSQPYVNPNPFVGGWSPAQTQPTIYTPTEPTEGMLITVLGNVYQYKGKEWVPFAGNDEEQVDAPAIPVKLDASAMLAALKEYRTFLEELDGLDNDTGEIVDDVVFGLRESIEALERLNG